MVKALPGIINLTLAATSGFSALALPPYILAGSVLFPARQRNEPSDPEAVW